MVGAIAANLHEGSRSEYLAQYLFASFGTAISVPHQEDSGIDLYCTLTEQIGARAWPRAYFSVQVKSTMDPWVLDGLDSVKWLIEHPLPLFLAIVDKSTARLRVYQTSPRFYVWSLPPLPERLELGPTLDEGGGYTQWVDGKRFSLGAPILDASVEELLDDTFHANAWNVLRFWIDVEQSNLAEIRGGRRQFRMPYSYVTNTTQHRGWSTQGITEAPDLAAAMDRTKECVSYLSAQLYRKGDLAGATVCALLLRRFFKDDYSGATHDPNLHTAINALIPDAGPRNYLFRGADSLNELIDQRLSPQQDMENSSSSTANPDSASAGTPTTEQ
jgi:hypothetical protein